MAGGLLGQPNPGDHGMRIVAALAEFASEMKVLALYALGKLLA